MLTSSASTARSYVVFSRPLTRSCYYFFISAFEANCHEYSMVTRRFRQFVFDRYCKSHVFTFDHCYRAVEYMSGACAKIKALGTASPHGIRYDQAHDSVAGTATWIEAAPIYTAGQCRHCGRPAARTTASVQIYFK